MRARRRDLARSWGEKRIALRASVRFLHHVRCAEAVIANADDLRWCLDDDAHLVMLLAAGKTGAMGG